MIKPSFQSTLIQFFILSLFFLHQGCTEQQQTRPEIVIIGGGLMGSAAAWHLADQGQNVILLEKQDSVYSEGSSLGKARIARSNNRGNDIWSYLHNRSVIEVNELIEFLNSRDDTYSIEDVYTTSPVTYVGRSEIYQQLMSSLIRQKIDYEIAVNKAEAEEKFDVNLPNDVLIQREYNQFSGTINPEQLISYLHQAIRLKGGEVHYNTTVEQLNIDSINREYTLRIKKKNSKGIQKWHAKRIISAAGPFTGQLLHEIVPNIDHLINPQRVFLGFLRITPEVYHNLSEAEKNKLQNFYPVINSSTGTREGSFFSMIEYTDKEEVPVIKIGGHFQRSPIENLNNVWQKELSTAEIDWCLKSTLRYFELLKLPIVEEHLEVVDGYSCVYSLTKNEVPIVSPIPDMNKNPNRNFIVMGGMSGVGAKGAMTYGLIAANIMLGNTEQDSMYQIVQKAIGIERLLEEVL